MATKTLQEMVSYLQQLKSVNRKAEGLALIQVMQDAKKQAKLNVKKNFIGRGGRRLSGRLLNSIFTTYEDTDKGAIGYIGTQGIPYGAIHEFGMNPLTTKRRKWLWIKTEDAWKSGQFKRITPQEFYDRQKKDSRYFYLKNLAMYSKSSSQNIPLFVLKKRVKIPPRSYLQPAIDVATKNYVTYYGKRLADLLR